MTDPFTRDLQHALYLADMDHADELRGETPPSIVQRIAFWAFTSIFTVLGALAVVAAGLRMVRAE